MKMLPAFVNNDAPSLTLVKVVKHHGEAVLVTGPQPCGI
jgi:hypothetical protein